MARKYLAELEEFRMSEDEARKRIEESGAKYHHTSIAGQGYTRAGEAYLVPYDGRFGKGFMVYTHIKQRKEIPLGRYAIRASYISYFLTEEKEQMEADFLRG